MTGAEFEMFLVGEARGMALYELSGILKFVIPA